MAEGYSSNQENIPQDPAVSRARDPSVPPIIQGVLFPGLSVVVPSLTCASNAPVI